jgi:hypothetical protein
MNFIMFLGLVHAIGAIVSLWVFTYRAGYSPWHGLSPRVLLMSPEWFAASMVKMLFWEVDLIVWLVNDRPASRWGVPDDSRSGRITRVVPLPAEVD